MKLKVGYPVYVQKEIEVDEKWNKFIEISKKSWGDLTKEEQIYFNDNMGDFVNDVDIQMGFKNWVDITTLDGHIF